MMDNSFFRTFNPFKEQIRLLTLRCAKLVSLFLIKIIEYVQIYPSNNPFVIDRDF